jgi:hypothetical protein
MKHNLLIEIVEIQGTCPVYRVAVLLLATWVSQAKMAQRTCSVSIRKNIPKVEPSHFA